MLQNSKRDAQLVLTQIFVLSSLPDMNLFY